MEFIAAGEDGFLLAGSECIFHDGIVFGRAKDQAERGVVARRAFLAVVKIHIELELSEIAARGGLGDDDDALAGVAEGFEEPEKSLAQGLGGEGGGADSILYRSSELEGMLEVEARGRVKKGGRGGGSPPGRSMALGASIELVYYHRHEF